MRTAGESKVFGIKLRVDPKILLGGMVMLAGVLFWYNERSTDDFGSASKQSSSLAHPKADGPVDFSPARRRISSRRAATSAPHVTWQVHPLDAAHGNIDPTLRLDLWARLRAAKEAANGRNVFEPVVPPAPPPPLPVKGPVIEPEPLPVAVTIHPALMPVQIQIPLKYFGYMNANKRQGSRGFFMDGDKVLVAAEGEIVKGRFLLVQLTPKTARVEDTQLQQEQLLPVTTDTTP